MVGRWWVGGGVAVAVAAVVGVVVVVVVVVVVGGGEVNGVRGGGSRPLTSDQPRDLWSTRAPL